MRAGRLRDRCFFQRPEQQVDDLGNAYNGWDPIRVADDQDFIWGDFRPTPGRETVMAGRLGGTSTGTLRVRSGTVTRSIDSSCRVLIDGVAYQIRGMPIDPDRRSAMVEFTVEAGVPT